MNNKEQEQNMTLTQDDLQAIKELFDKSFSERIISINAKLDRIDGHLDNMEGSLDRMDGHLDKIDGHLDNLEEGVEDVRTKMNRLVEWTEKVSVITNVSL